ncbi:Acyl-CoA synthetase member 3, mitochondrial [Desmophyllum pertusum]|uniref:Acyl-CoA synthetase member 3, mitochondrial n=1 Tax=Desmophyllum pertusum TaxID=174260 RepID=A0A9W9YHB8_9CNID|nr:Acyl-CoA synthetase member 3, mitochondrial [Desmophyllum pertusum]
MVSGSAALPEPVMRKMARNNRTHLVGKVWNDRDRNGSLQSATWTKITGLCGKHLYLRTEIRIVSQNMDGKSEIVVEGNEHGSSVCPGKEGQEGELQVRGTSVFKWLVYI